MKIEFLDSNSNEVTIVETSSPLLEFKHFKSMMPQITSWKEYIEPYVEPVVPVIPFATLQADKLKSAGIEFVKRRDATTYVTQLDGVTVYGYDRQTDDMVNFMAARERAKLAESVPYKVYLSDGSKALIDHTLDMFDMCLNQSATEQLSAYAWYEDIKAQISACTTEAELDAITW